MCPVGSVSCMHEPNQPLGKTSERDLFDPEAKIAKAKSSGVCVCAQKVRCAATVASGSLGTVH